MASLRRRTLALMAVTGAALGLPLLPVGNAIAQTSTSAAEAKGAQTYCFLRTNGNDHVTSWNAAYALIKRQSASLFKTSPEHASVMITEAVVQNPNTFPNCGRYLGDLYSSRVSSKGEVPATSEGPTALPVQPSSQAGQGGMTRGERFGN